MLKRFTYLEKDLALGNSGERTVDINTRDPISALWIEFRCANGASWNHNNPMHDCVSDIEVIDGSDILMSMDAQQALAVEAADLGYLPHQRFSELGGDSATANLGIRFGRHLLDTEYALDPTRFTNPQLRVKWNLAANQAVGATGYADGGLTMTVIAEAMDGAPAPRGFLSSKEWYTYTSAAGHEYVDLPTDRPYRSLWWKSYLASYHPYGVVSNLKLDCDAGKYVPIDLAVEDFLYLLMRRQPAYRYRNCVHVKDGDTLYNHLTELESVVGINEESYDGVISYINYEYGNQTIDVYIAGVAATSYFNFGLEVHGYCPFGYMLYPFGDKDDPDTWFPAPVFRSIRLDMTGAVASGAVAVGLTQERLY